MSAPYNFRTAFNGFNREDVVHYIEYVNSNHNNQINQLKSDLSAAKKEIAALRSLPVQDDKVAELTARCEEQELQLSALRTELESLRAELGAAAPAAKGNTQDELEAYRRAERTERQAKERADAMYQQAAGILADATAKVDEATAQIGSIAEQVVAQLAVFQEAVGSSKQILADATATLAAIRPTEE